MISDIESIGIANQRDAAWLVALYLAIHGGDPSPDGGLVSREQTQGAALSAIAALSEALDEKSKTVLEQTLAPIQKQFPLKIVNGYVAEERLQAMGIEIKNFAGENAPTKIVTSARNSRYCVRFRSQILCVEIRVPDPPPFA